MEWKDGTIKLENQLAKIVAIMRRIKCSKEESRIYRLKYEEKN
jgi:hypothetical protein